MEDHEIINLYWKRNEAAIQETSYKYGRFCHSLAFNILKVPEDAEECVGTTPNKLAGQMYRLRKSLSGYLTAKGVAI